MRGNGADPERRAPAANGTDPDGSAPDGSGPGGLAPDGSAPGDADDDVVQAVVDFVDELVEDGGPDA